MPCIPAGWQPASAPDNGWGGRIWQFIARCLAISVEEGARTVVYLASSPDVTGVSGRYFVREQMVDSSRASTDEAATQRLWKISQELTRLAPVSS